MLIAAIKCSHAARVALQSSRFTAARLIPVGFAPRICVRFRSTRSKRTSDDVSSLLGSVDNVREVVASIQALAATALTRPDMARPLVEGGMPAAVFDTCSRTLPNAVRSGNASEVCAAFDASMNSLGSPLQLASQICGSETLPKLIREVEVSLAEGVAGGGMGAAPDGGSSDARRKGKPRGDAAGMELLAKPQDPLPAAAPSSFTVALSHAREALLVSIADTLVRAARSVPSDDDAAAAELHGLVSNCCASGFFACAVAAASAVGAGTTAAAPLAGKLASACDALARSSSFASDSLHAMGLPSALARAMAHPGLQEGALADAWCGMARAFVQLHSEAGAAASASVNAVMDAHAAEDNGAEAATADSEPVATAAASAAAAPGPLRSPLTLPVPLPYPLPAEAVRLPDFAAYHINGWDGGGRRMLALSLVLLRLLARSGEEPTRRAVERVARKCRGRSAAGAAAAAAIELADKADDASAAKAAGTKDRRRGKGDGSKSIENEEKSKALVAGPLLIAAGSPLRAFASLRPMIDDIVEALQALPPPAPATTAVPAAKGKDAKKAAAPIVVAGASVAGAGRSKPRARSATPTDKSRSSAAVDKAAAGAGSGDGGKVTTAKAAASPSPATTARAAQKAAVASAASASPAAKAGPMPVAAAIKAAAAAVASSAAASLAPADSATSKLIAAAVKAAGPSKATKAAAAATAAAAAKTKSREKSKRQPQPKKEVPRRYPKGQSKRARPRGADVVRTMQRAAATAASTSKAAARSGGGTSTPARPGSKPKKA